MFNLHHFQPIFKGKGGQCPPFSSSLNNAARSPMKQVFGFVEDSLSAIFIQQDFVSPPYGKLLEFIIRPPPCPANEKMSNTAEFSFEILPHLFSGQYRFAVQKITEKLFILFHGNTPIEILLVFYANRKVCQFTLVLSLLRRLRKFGRSGRSSGRE